MKNISFLLLLFFIIIKPAIAEIKILEWNEGVKLTKEGRKSQIRIKIKAINIPPNSGITSFSLGSNSSNKFIFSDVKQNFKPAKFDFNNGVLQINFNEPLINNQETYLEFFSQETYSKINNYLRQEQFYIPEFARQATGKIEIDIGDNYELISNHKNIFYNNHIVNFTGIVPSGGISEILKITNSGVIWDISIKSKIKLQNGNGTLEITAPYLFRGGAQSVRNQTIGASVYPQKHLTTRQNDILTFAVNPSIKEIIIENKAQVATGKNFRIENNRSSDQYLETSEEERVLLLPILNNIINDSKFENLPLHVKILNFVHNYIKYDMQYYGKLLTVPQIISTKSGVCSEFATLFNALARVAKIPSSIVHGYALGEYDKFESHAWNMIFVNNRWVHVDPTWNLSSGIVSSSHIYLKDNRKEELLIKYEGKEAEIIIEREFDIKDSKKI
jgi:hypothetical protein